MALRRLRARRHDAVRQLVSIEARNAAAPERASTWLLPVAMPPVSATLSTTYSRGARTGAEPALGRRQRVLQQHRDRQRSDAAGNRRQRARHLLDRRMDVAEDQAPRRSNASRRLLPAGNSASIIARSSTRRGADVDDRRAGLDEVRRDECRPPSAATRMSASRATAGRSAVRE